VLFNRIRKSPDRYRNGCCSAGHLCPAHWEIALRYRRPRKPYVFAEERLDELIRLARYRHADVLPVSAEGERFVFVVAHHLPEPKGIRQYIAEAAPWYDEDDAARLIGKVTQKRYRFGADKLASREWLAVTLAERQALGQDDRRLRRAAERAREAPPRALPTAQAHP
jgi:hypothetical protein